jgi:hypothetical protein
MIGVPCVGECKVMARDRFTLHRSFRPTVIAATLICVVLLMLVGHSLLSSGPTSFNLASGTPASTGNSPTAAAVGDLNGDGSADVVVANASDNSVSVLLNNGDGTFSAAPGSPITVGITPISAALADVNHDGKVDMLVASMSDNAVRILLGNGDGTFAASGPAITVGTSPS